MSPAGPARPGAPTWFQEMGDSLLRQRPPKFGLMTLTSPSWLTHAEITPLTGEAGEPGVRMRSANAVEGAASATAAKTTKDRNELVSIFLHPHCGNCGHAGKGSHGASMTPGAVLGGEMGRPG